MKKLFRVHITCPAKHTTYIDYKTLKYAQKYLNDNQDKTDWYATHIETINKEEK